MVTQCKNLISLYILPDQRRGNLLVYIYICTHTYFADAPPDEPLGETDCCGFNVFNVYFVAVQIEIYIRRNRLFRCF